MGESVKKMKGHSGSGRPMNAFWTSCAVVSGGQDAVPRSIGLDAGANSVGVLVPCECVDHTRNKYIGVIADLVLLGMKMLFGVQRDREKV